MDPCWKMKGGQAWDPLEEYSEGRVLKAKTALSGENMQLYVPLGTG